MFAIILRCFVYVFCANCVCSLRILNCPFDKYVVVDTLDQYDLVYVNYEDDITIPCCQKDPTPTKYWYKVDRFQLEKEVALDPDVAKISDDFELTIEQFQENHTGAYFCQDPWYITNVTSNNYYYLIDIVRKSEPVSYGNIKDFKKYLITSISPVSEYLSDFKSKPELMSLYQQTGLTLEVDLRCDEWSDCDPCKKEKQRDCHCHIQPHLIDSKLCGTKCAIYKYALHMDCRAVWTAKRVLPVLAQRIKGVSDFRRVVKCVGLCGLDAIGGVTYVKKFKLYDIAVGTSLMLVCPGYAITKQCFWRRDGNKLYSNEYELDRKVSVNEFAVLYIADATTKESGNYSCYLDDVLITQNRVRVIEVFSEKNASWWRHMKYLQYIVLLCFIVLVGGLVTAVMQRRSFEEIDMKDAIEKFLKRRFDHEKLEPPKQSE